MRLILFLVLVYIFIRLINRFFFSATQRTRRMTQPPNRGPAVREMVQDPVCKIYVPKRDALTLTRDGATYYFCCADCLKKFDASAHG